MQSRCRWCGCLCERVQVCVCMTEGAIVTFLIFIGLEDHVKLV